MQSTRLRPERAREIGLAPVGLPAGAAWNVADAVALGTAHITSIPHLAARRYADPVAQARGLPPTSQASRSEGAQALTLLVGTIGILFGLALLAGAPLAGIR